VAALTPLLVFLAVLAVRSVYWAALEATPLSEWHLWRETDEWGFLDWSSRLAAGNWMDRPAWRAYFSWQVPGGPAPAWEARYQPNAYFTGPLYAYGLALLRAAFGSPIVSARLLQLLLAAATAAALAAATAKVLRRRAGNVVAVAGALFAGLMDGLYAPSVFHDGFLYRDGPVGHVGTLLMVMPLLASGSWGALAAGLLGGFGALLKQTLLPLGIVAAALVWRRAPAGADRGRALVFAGAGLAVPLLAMALRNVAVGVPPLTFDTRQATSFVWGNVRGADATTVPPARMPAVLDEAKGSTLKAFQLVLASYRDAPLEYPRLLAKKLVTFFGGFEVPDDASLYFFRDRLPVLPMLPVYTCLLGPGIVGLCAALARGILRRGEALLALVAFLVPLGSSLMVQTVSRYRVAVSGPLALGAGLLLGICLDDLLRARVGRAAALAAGSLFLSGVTLLPSVIPAGRHRWVDTVVYATLVERHVSPQAAAGEVARYLEEGRDDPQRALGLIATRRWWNGDRSGVRLEPQGVASPGRRFAPPKER